ncbi:hypothetical protein NQ317_008433 [Molorchus minor]|uniref:Uncharacterized protein n=1 Tax=Molorchus minor TaxID=1323400 RepID=A0ABQ9JD25_9CUCU|nr:hypothetical protein NQ317_008433 [Molorchus minor]
MLFRNSKEKYHNYIDILLKKIVMNSNKSYQDCLCDVLVNIFVRDPTTLANWGKSYPKNVAASALVLAYLDTHWKSIHKRIDRSAITDLLNNFIVVNDELAMKKEKEDGLNDCIKAIKCPSVKAQL